MRKDYEIYIYIYMYICRYTYTHEHIRCCVATRSLSVQPECGRAGLACERVALCRQIGAHSCGHPKPADLDVVLYNVGT